MESKGILHVGIYRTCSILSFGQRPFGQEGGSLPAAQDAVFERDGYVVHQLVANDVAEISKWITWVAVQTSKNAHSESPFAEGFRGFF